MAWKIPLSTSTQVTIAIDLNTIDSLYVSRGVTIAATSADAVRGTGNQHEVVVDGTIAAAAEGSGVFLGANYSNFGQVVTVNSGGLIRGFDDSAAVIIYGYDSTVTNYGEITAVHNAICLAGNSSTSTSTIVNSGLISAKIAIKNFQPEALRVENTGTIRGTTSAIEASGLADTIINKGNIKGQILLGKGNDLYDGPGGTIVGDVFGGEGDDRLYAGAGDNRLFGEIGNDVLAGGAGADFLSGGVGKDTVTYFYAKAGVTASLISPTANKGDAAGDTYSLIENLNGSTFSDNLRGNYGSNTIYGNKGNDIINGDGGNDIINGGVGKDVLTGGVGKDTFVFQNSLISSNVDKITDFSVATDKIQLDSGVFTALTTPGVLSAAPFRANETGKAQDSNDRIIYETDTGKLFYDQDGTGSRYQSQHFATLTTKPLISYTDFFIVV